MENLVVVVLFCSAVGLAASGTQNISKGAVSQSLGLKRRTVVNCASRDRFPPPLSLAGNSGLPKSTPPAHSWNQVRAVELKSPLQVTTCRAVTKCRKYVCNTYCNVDSFRNYSESLCARAELAELKSLTVSVIVNILLPR